MARLVPDNDYFLIEVLGEDKNPLGLIGTQDPEEGIREGRVVAISEKPTFFGMTTYAFDKSLGDFDLLDKMYEHYKQYVGKKVYWPERTESGTVIKYNDKFYAHVKWSAISSHEEDD